MHKIPNRIDTPCGTCTLCCRNNRIILIGEEELRKFPEHGTPFKDCAQLDHKPNGECVYLDVTGCRVHADKPEMCRVFDCRTFSQYFTWTQARTTKWIDLRVWWRGMDLSKQNPDP